MASYESTEVFNPTVAIDPHRQELDPYFYISFETVVKVSVYRGDAPGSVLMFDVTTVNEAVAAALDSSLFDQYKGSNSYSQLNVDKKIEYKYQEVVDMSTSGCVVDMVYDITLKIHRDEAAMNDLEAMSNQYNKFIESYMESIFLEKAQPFFDKLYTGDVRYVGVAQGFNDGSESLTKIIFREISYKSPAIWQVVKNNHRALSITNEDEFDRPRLHFDPSTVTSGILSNNIKSIISWSSSEISGNSNLYVIVSLSICFLMYFILQIFLGKWRKTPKTITETSVVSAEAPKLTLAKPALVSTISSSSTSSASSYDRKFSPKASQDTFKEPRRITVSPRLALNPNSELSFDTVDEESSLGSYSALSSIGHSSGEATPSENPLNIPDLNLDMSLINYEDKSPEKPNRTNKTKKKGSKGLKNRKLKATDTEIIHEEIPTEGPLSPDNIPDSTKLQSPVRPCVINIHVKSSPEKTAKSNV